eukprot:193194_1
MASEGSIEASESEENDEPTSFSLKEVRVELFDHWWETSRNGIIIGLCYGAFRGRKEIDVRKRYRLFRFYGIGYGLFFSIMSAVEGYLMNHRDVRFGSGPAIVYKGVAGLFSGGMLTAPCSPQLQLTYALKGTVVGVTWGMADYLGIGPRDAQRFMKEIRTGGHPKADQFLDETSPKTKEIEKIVDQIESALDTDISDVDSQNNKNTNSQKK